MRIGNLLAYFAFVKKWLLLGFLLSMLVMFFYFRLDRYLTFDTMREYQFLATEWTTTHYKTSVTLYIALFALLIACAIPCATLLTLLGGFLFGGIAVIYATFSTTLGGTILFLAVRTAFGAHITKKSTGWIKHMEAGFQRNAFNYLLSLRLMPIFPCWISNIAAGALNIPLKTFILATIIGILPSTFIYAMAGRGLDNLFLSDQPPNLNMIFTPSIFLPLLGLAILSLFPVIYKSVKKQNKDR